ncbi:MAG: ADP-forming succinate--CoA ligase subunit beta [Helicobacteraceae bacterium]|jgi:succinyl-CoA synthetase beta subunit|nr:ADP-forming succinate--CoA ligase subunit beta [Helicobacteraceae bacterium]
MNIHEYQAKAILREFGAQVLAGFPANTSSEAREAAAKIGGDLWVVKAQIHAGGRGKAGGVKIARSLDEVEKIAGDLLGKTLITPQTGEAGKVVQRLYIESGAKIAKEFYLSIALDRARETPVMIASAEGGMEIEEIAAKSPEKIAKVAIDPLTGFLPMHARSLAFALGIAKEQFASFAKFCAALYRAYAEKDANMAEINPLALLENGEFIALDAKMGFDDNALFRHTDIEALRDLFEEEPSETEAAAANLSYVRLAGEVGCMVNGAGLAMATMDIIKHEGGAPANFLDVGGGASAETVARGFEIILRDRSAKAIFVNIFGGIVRCDRVANGILEAAKRVDLNLPVIVRLDGTNAAEAREILRSANIPNIIAAENLTDGAKKAVEAAK